MLSRGSVIPFFYKRRNESELPITDAAMTRFMISLTQGIDLVSHAFIDMVGGEIYVRKIPSMRVTDIAECINPGAKQKIIGIRPGEKLHEEMVSLEEARSTYEYDDYYKILPQTFDWDKDPARIKDGVLVKDDFRYSSDTNTEWMKKETLSSFLRQEGMEI